MAADVGNGKSVPAARDPRIPSLAGFRLRLVLLAALILIPLYALLIGNVVNEYAVARNEVRDDGMRLVRLIAIQQERSVASIKPLLAALAKLPDVVTRSPACDEFVAGILRENPSLAGIGAAGTDGTVYCAGNPAERGTSVSGKQWFIRAVGGKEFVAGDYEVAPDEGKRTIGFGLPFFGADGAPAGVVFASLDLETLNRIALKVNLPPDSVLTVVDRAGTVLARYPDPQQWVGKTVPDAPLVKALRESQIREGIFEAPGLTGVERIFAYTSLDETTASSPYVTIGYAKSVLLAPADRDFTLNLLGLALLTLVVFLLAWMGGNYLIIDRIRALQDVDRLKGEFVSIASHQLRTPLTSLRWVNELLASGTVGPLTPEQSELVRQSEHTLKDLRALVDDLLQASAFDTGKVMRAAPTDAVAVAKDAVAELALQITKKSLSFSASYWEGAAMVSADPLFLKQAIVNLLANAVRYTPKAGTVALTVGVKNGDVRVEVVDSGLGIPEADRKRIFERFFRATNVRSRYSSGTGLGLHLAKMVIDRSGGKIGFVSRENAGSTFWFTLPRIKS